jgi:hypothetical protein
VSGQDDPYSRIYWRLADEFPRVWDDDRALAAYTRLLVVADGAWPSAAAIPVGVPPRTWRSLVEAGLVIPEASGRRFRIRGLDKHRAARSNAARNAVNARWQRNGRNTESTTDGNTRVVEGALHIPSRDETSQAEPSNGAGAWDVVELVERLTQRPWVYGSGNPTLETLKADVRDFGRERVEEALTRYRAEHPGPMDAAVLVTGTHRVLMPLQATTAMTREQRAEAEREALLEKYGRRSA